MSAHCRGGWGGGQRGQKEARGPGAVLRALGQTGRVRKGRGRLSGDGVGAGRGGREPVEGGEAGWAAPSHPVE